MNKKIIISSTISVVILTLIIIGGIYFYKTNKVTTVLTIDINPSMKLSLNYKNEVVKVEGLNEDGKNLIKKENFKGDDLSDAIEEITELIVDNGYITKEDNHILISSEGKNIKDEVVKLFDKELKEEEIECKVIAQEITKAAKENAEKYGITENKASFIESLIKENEDLTFEDLKDKTINEITEIIETKEEEKEEEPPKKEENKNPSSGDNASKPSVPSKPSKPSVTYNPPASNDRTGAWCEFYKTIPPEGGVEYETPGFITDGDVYAQKAKEYLPNDSSYDSVYSSMTSYKTASYCSCGIVEVENQDKTKKYKVYLDSVTLELLEPVIVTEMPKPKIDEAGALVIVTKWLSDKYGVDINTCGNQYFYYAIDGSTNIPEWQFNCKVEETGKYYAVVVNAISGDLSNGRSW